jgi:protein SCO1/2
VSSCLRGCFVLSVLLFISACSPAPAPKLQGTDLEKFPSPDFELNDANDKPFRLSDQKGHVVVLTFLYTNCPDECPLIAERFREAAGSLGKDAADVRFVAVSLDPEHDTNEAIRAFLKAHQVESILTYLKGSRPELAAIWKQYYISVLPPSVTGIVTHQSRVVVIDRNGLQRSNFGADLDAKSLVNDIRIALQN